MHFEKLVLVSGRIQHPLARWIPAVVDDFVAAGAHRFKRIQSRSTSAAQVVHYQLTGKLQDPVDFNIMRNLVRDQEVDGSNPFAPTILFKHFHAISGFSSTAL